MITAVDIKLLIIISDGKQNIHYFTTVTSSISFFFTTKKAHETTTPANLQMYAEPHQLFTFDASNPLPNDD